MDWESIEGYKEGMTTEEKLALLEKHHQATSKPVPPAEPPKPESTPPAEPPKPEPTEEPPKPVEKTVSKVQFDKVASDLAAAKKQLRAKMTEDEVKEHERNEELEKNRIELEELRKDKMVSEYKSSYLGLGFDEEMALNSANALAEGDTDAVFADIKKYMVSFEANLRAKILKETPVPPPGDNPDGSASTVEEEISNRIYGKKG